MMSFVAFGMLVLFVCGYEAYMMRIRSKIKAEHRYKEIKALAGDYKKTLVDLLQKESERSRRNF